MISAPARSGRIISADIAVIVAVIAVPAAPGLRGLHSGIAISMASGILSSMDVSSGKVRENRLRRMAKRQGMRLEKSRRRDRRAIDYGTYGLIDASTNAPIIRGGSGVTSLTLDEVEKRLTIERMIVPSGATFTIPAGAIQLSVDQNGASRLQITEVHSSVQTWPDWLAIAFNCLKEASTARKRLTAATSAHDRDAESEAITDEFKASLQTMTASVIALDGFYGAICDMVPVSPAVREERQRKESGRAVWVADAIIRASRMPGAVQKTLTKDIHTAYKARDTAVHPKVKTGRFAHHPALPGAPVPQLYADFIVEASQGLVQLTVEAIMWVTDHPQPRNAAITAYAPTASEMLHRIVDPAITIDPQSPLARRPR
jgi:hypothetical protein